MKSSNLGGRTFIIMISLTPDLFSSKYIWSHFKTFLTNISQIILLHIIITDIFNIFTY